MYAALVQERLVCISTEASAVYIVDKVVQTVNQVLAESAEESAPKRPCRPRKGKLKARTPQIRSAITSKKAAFYQWKAAGRPNDEDNQLLVQKTATTKSLRQICSRENAHQYMQDKQEILNAKGQDTALFFRLINIEVSLVFILTSYMSVIQYSNQRKRYWKVGKNISVS